jgi:glutaredoxin
VTVFTTAACTHCRRAKAALASADVNYVEVDVGEDLELLARLKAFTGRGTVPQVICTCTFHAVPRSAAEFLGGGRVFVQSNIQGWPLQCDGLAAWQPRGSWVERSTNACSSTGREKEAEERHTRAALTAQLARRMRGRRRLAACAPACVCKSLSSSPPGTPVQHHPRRVLKIRRTAAAGLGLGLGSGLRHRPACIVALVLIWCSIS